jgi:hypothetical protein
VSQKPVAECLVTTLYFNGLQLVLRAALNEPVLGAAGLSLSLAGGASAAGAQVADALTHKAVVSHEITLGEEEIARQLGDILCLRHKIIRIPLAPRSMPEFRRTGCSFPNR